MGAPIKNAKVTIEDNLSCIINMVGKRRIFPDYRYSTITDSIGRYHFDNLDIDSFTCTNTIQKVSVVANGYRTQTRTITPGQESILDFDLLRITGCDSAIEVTVTVFKIDTTWICNEGDFCTPHVENIPLPNYCIELPDQYLSWFKPRIIDTTNMQGKATFTLSISVHQPEFG